MRGLIPTVAPAGIETAGGASTLSTRSWNRLSRAMTAEAITCAGATVLLLWLVLYPLLMLLIGSVPTDRPLRPGAFTFAIFASLFANADNLEAIVNTLVSSALATIVAVAMGVSLAWVTSRTDTPGRRFFDNAFVIPYYLSPFIGAIAWTLLANPRIGFINNFFTDALGFEDAPINISSIIVLIQQRMLANKSYATVTGKGFNPAVVTLGRLRYVALAICILYFAVSIVLPYAALVFTSVQPYLSFAFEPSSWTLDKYAEVLTNPLTARATVNSLLLGVGGATLTIFFSLIISYVVHRTRMRARYALDYLATLPVGVPAVLFAGALLWGYIFLPVPIYGTIWMLLIAYIAHYIPFGVRAATSGLVQISVELEESARVHGETWIGTMRKIVIPLLKPALTVGWILLFVEFIRSLSLSILLYTPESVVMPVVTYELYETGAYPALAAFSVLQTLLMFVAIYAAKKIAGVDNFMQLK